MLRNIWNTIFVDTFYKVEAEKSTSLQFDKKAITILFVVAFSLLFIEYFGNFHFLISSLNEIHLTSLADWLTSLQNYFPNQRLFQLAYWVSILITFYFIIPTLIIKLIFKDKLRNYGISPKGFFNNYKIYVIFFLFMVPLILFVSTTDSFQHKYPFYNPKTESLWPNFIIWQCLYLSQFFALEFFFRGFMLHGIKKRFGFYSIWIMMIPYMMIHFQKPMPETIGAIFAGIILGTLSLKSRSIWLGVAIHYSVAITMDLAALWQKGYFD
ncbi:MAG: CPBP family intramembrane metalloprotease [Flavobacteriales bacterium]|nr:CPBP family intramembrane metalloprotease [Flavobacteriales bacterium]